MVFCTNCGAEVDGRFCGKCGAAIGGTPAAPPAAPPPPSYQQPEYQQQAYQQPQPQPQYQQPAFQQQAYPPAPPPAKKKAGPLVWILGCLGIVVVLGAALGIGGYIYVKKKAQDAGFDSALAQKNPALAAAKMMVAVNPEIEIVKSDDDAGTLTIREKKTGKIITMNAEDIQNGKISFTEEGSGQTMTFGGGGKLPGWVPSYPGSNPEGMFSAAGGENEGGSAHFKTSDPAAQVLKFYENALKTAGYKITTSTVSDTGGMVVGEDEANKRSVVATVGADGGETSVMLNYAIKK